jgi:hypothetical protein
MQLRVPRPMWIAIPTAVLVVAVIGVQVGLPLYRRQAAFVTIDRLGGDSSSTRSAPDWLWHLLGDTLTEPWDDVQGVYLMKTTANDADLSSIAALTSVRFVYLDETQVTDAGLAHLQAMKGLETLSLSGTRLTDSGLEILKGLTNLENLYLHDTEVTNAGVAELQRTLPDLKIER